MSINVNSLDDIVYVITNEDEVVYLTTIPNDIGQSPIQFQEEGVNVGVAGSVNTIDFVGATVTISQVGGKLTVTITSAGGGVTTVGNLTPLFTASIAGVTMSFAQIVKAANLIFAGPATGADANPDFRALVAADIPGSTVGLALLALTNPGAITFLRVNADNTVTARSRADFLNDIFLLIANTQTNDYTLVLADQNLVVDMNKATAITLTVPPNSSVAFPVGTFIYVRRIGAGTLTIAQGSGVTVTGSSGALTDPGLNVMMTLRKTATDTWDLQNGSPGTWTSWVPTFTGFSVDPSSYEARYILQGKMCTVLFGGTSAVSGTSNATNFVMTLPFQAKERIFIPVMIQNNSVILTSPGRVFTNASGSNLTVQRTLDGATAFTASGSKMVWFQFSYEIL